MVVLVGAEPQSELIRSPGTLIIPQSWPDLEVRRDDLLSNMSIVGDANLLGKVAPVCPKTILQRKGKL